MSFILIMFALPLVKIFFICLLDNSFTELETWKVKQMLLEIGISEFGQAGLISIRFFLRFHLKKTNFYALDIILLFLFIFYRNFLL